MFTLSNPWLPRALKIRFTRPFMFIEKTAISLIARVYVHGDVKDYTEIRQDAYHLWNNEYTGEQISKALKLPKWLVNNWIEIWELYIQILGDKNENNRID